jgi:hypothetical protein
MDCCFKNMMQQHLTSPHLTRMKSESSQTVPRGLGGQALLVSSKLKACFLCCNLLGTILSTMIHGFQCGQLCDGHQHTCSKCLFGISIIDRPARRDDEGILLMEMRLICFAWFRHLGCHELPSCASIPCMLVPPFVVASFSHMTATFAITWTTTTTTSAAHHRTSIQIQCQDHVKHHAILD